MSLAYKTSVMDPVFSDTIIAELDPRFSRETVLIAANTDMPFGLVMAHADGKWQPYAQTDADAEDASPAPSPGAVLITPLEASEDSQEAVIITGYAILNANGLAWDSTVTDEESALDELSAKGFVIQHVEAK